jgi:hypothetical protein
MSAIELDNLFGSKKPKDPNIIRLNFAKRNGLVDDEQYARILQYLESDKEDVRNLGATTLKGLIQKSSM